MRVCPQCGHRGEGARCPSDGHLLVADGVLAPEPGAAALVGRRFGGRYRVDALVGQGGMGWVFRGTHETMRQVVALKVMRRDAARDVASVKRFTREARDCSRLRHHNTIKVFDFGVSDDGYPYIVMEFLEGRPLSAVLRDEGALPVERALAIVDQICASLDEAHDQGLVHRDLKPANVFLTRVHNDPDYVKVLDFGIAKSVGPRGARPGGDSGDETLTESGVVIGTPAYLSPEQAQAAPVDRRADLYALGIILFELLTGHVPFDSPITGALFAKQIYEPAPPLPKSVDGRAIPKALRRLVARLLEKDPARRPATAADVATTIRTLRAALREGRADVDDGLLDEEDTTGSLADGADDPDATGILDPERTTDGRRAGRPGRREDEDTAAVPVARPSLAAWEDRGPVEPARDDPAWAPTRAAGAATPTLEPPDAERVPPEPPRTVGETAAPRPDWRFRVVAALVLVASGVGGFLAVRAFMASESVVAAAARPAPRTMHAEGEASPPVPATPSPSAGKATPTPTPTPPSTPTPTPTPKVPDTPAVVSVRVVSSPAGAIVRDGDETLGRTPIAVDVASGASRALTLTRSGYRPQTIQLSAAAAPAVAVTLERRPRRVRPRSERPGPRPGSAKKPKPSYEIEAL